MKRKRTWRSIGIKGEYEGEYGKEGENEDLEEETWATFWEKMILFYFYNFIL